MNSASLSSPQTDENQTAENNGSTQIHSVEILLAQLCADIHMQFSAMNERKDKLVSSLEQRISNKVAQLLDKRVNSEMTKIKSKVESDLTAFKGNLKADKCRDSDEINAKISSLAPSWSVQSDISLNVVIRNLPESSNENTKAKVNSLSVTG